MIQPHGHADRNRWEWIRRGRVGLQQRGVRLLGERIDLCPAHVRQSSVELAKGRVCRLTRAHGSRSAPACQRGHAWGECDGAPPPTLVRVRGPRRGVCSGELRLEFGRVAMATRPPDIIPQV
eukprot:4072042-Prymnesium_polylepis.1